MYSSKMLPSYSSKIIGLQLNKYTFQEIFEDTFSV